ncbi:MAG: prepilin-type N-terminal cleavage/methylation domain-containing protein [Desulfobacteraceae bacterium]|nr:prepilin-type N-terminal cleavage/methylation domain-containing protein [Desulfobacteraceae bacterium]
MNRGFTLIEILIAVLIFGVLMTTLFTSFQSFITSSTVVGDGLAQDERIRTLLGHLERDLGALYITRPPRYKKPATTSDPDPFRFHGTRESAGGTQVSKLGFASLNHLSLGGADIPGVARIIYRVRSNDDNGMDLCRADTLRPFEEPRERACDPVLVRDISGFDLTYVDEDGDEHTSWDSESGTVKYTLPVSIKFKITLDTGDTPRIIETQIPIPVSREALD